MKRIFVTARIGLAVTMFAGWVLTSGGPATAQEKRTIFTEDSFHWQGKLAAGKTLEVIGQNGEIEAAGTADDFTQVDATKRGHGDANKGAYIEVVEYADGVTICAVYAKDAKPGRCHRGGVESQESSHWSWRNDHAKITFSLKVPRGVILKAETTNGSIHGRDLNSVVDASTTNGSVDVATSEWASGRTTNGHVDIAMGKADWSGELELSSTNGGITVSLPSSATFKVNAETTNGGVRTDFPITVLGSFKSKSISGTVGAGGRELKLETTNGGIELKKSGA